MPATGCSPVQYHAQAQPVIIILSRSSQCHTAQIILLNSGSNNPPQLLPLLTQKLWCWDGNDFPISDIQRHNNSVAKRHPLPPELNTFQKQNENLNPNQSFCFFNKQIFQSILNRKLHFCSLYIKHGRKVVKNWEPSSERLGLRIEWSAWYHKSPFSFSCFGKGRV